MALDKDEIYSEIQTRLNARLAIVIGTGCSMSIHPDFGMAALEKHLNNSIPHLIKGDKQAQADWKNVSVKRTQNIDFENALNEVKSEFLLDKIIAETGKHVTTISSKTLYQVHQGNIPLILLFSKLKHLLSPSHPLLDIITPNYDLIIENALSQCGIPYTDGFWGEYRKTFNWQEAKNNFIRYIDSVKPKGVVRQPIPFVKLHKVHGSLNYFIQNNDIVRIDTLSYFTELKTYERFIITPGESKHKRIVQNRNFYFEMDKTIEEVNTYLFVGYGFNDIDIDKKICANIESRGRKAVIVTKELTSSNGMLLINNPQNIIIIDNKKGGATIFYDNEKMDIDTPIWKIDEFTKEIL